AQSQKKRFVSILFEEVSLESLPPILAGIQWIDFRPGIKEFHTAFSELLRAIDTDRDHVSAHTRWSLAATKWIDSDRDDEFLLRGVEFEMASVWLQKATEEHKNPEPTAAITSFIEASRLEIQAQSRRKKMAAQRWRFMTVLMTLLAILAFILAGWSYKLLQSSHRAQANATAQRNKAILARRDADQRLVEANVAKKEAEKAKANAQRNYELAVLQQQRAVQNESLAIKKTKEAEANLNRSIESENKARELASFAKMQENLAKASAADAYNRLMETRALNFVAKAREEENKNPTLAMQLALAASNIVSNKEIQSTISSIFYKNNFSIPVLKLDVPIKKIRMLPMGDYFAVLSGSSVVEIYDGAGKKVKSFVGHQAEVTAIDFSADGRYAITASNDRTVRLWDVYTQKSSVLCAKLPKVNDIAFSPDAKFVGLACADNTATIWDRRGNQILVLNKHDASVNAIRFSPDGKYILTGSDDQTAILWNQNGSRKYTLRRHHGAITQVGFSPDKQLILTASADHSIGIWDAKGKVVALLDGHTQAITDACFSFDSQYVLSGSDDKTARMWTVNGEEISLFKGHQAEVTSVRLQAGDSEFAFTASADNTVKKWLLNSNQHTSRTSMLARPSLFEVSQTGYVAICYEKSEDILLLDEHSEPIRKLSKHKSEVKQICFGAKGKILASLDAKSKVFVWSLDGNSIASFTAPYGVITNMKLSPKGDRLAFVVNNRKIAICDLKGNVLGLLSGHIADITGLDFSTDDKNILSVSEDGTSQLWDASYKSINVRNPNYGKASACRFIPRTKLFIVGYANGVIREWDLTGNTKLLFRAGDFAVESITTAADGESFAASYSDKSVRIWDVNSGEMQQFISLQNAIVGYGFASEDKTLIACMSDKTIRNWNRRISIDAYEKKYGFTPLPIAQQIEYGLVDFQTVKESEDINTLIDAASYYSSNTFEIDEKLNLYNQQNSVILLNRAFRKDSTRILVQKRLLKAYSDLSWAFLLTRDPRAEIPARFALQYATETDPLYVRYATALLYNNKWEEAKSIYEQFAQKYYLDTRKKFTEVCAEELDKLDQLGITCNLSLKARELLKNL
ncbi:MAG: hypothetical protein RIS47_459, partial [Bacteroidota bacterium]